MLLQGHGVASGVGHSNGPARLSPYPKGTIEMQTPFFKAAGLDLSPFWPGTLNVSFAPAKILLNRPDFHFEHLNWTNLHPPETFSFWKIRIRSFDPRPCEVAGLVYWPHPETKIRHWQNHSVLELLAPRLDGIYVNQYFEVGVDPGAIQIVDH